MFVVHEHKVLLAEQGKLAGDRASACAPAMGGDASTGQ